MSEQLRVRTIKSNRRQTTFAAILTLMLAFTMLFAIPPSLAHSPPQTIPTWTYAAVSPDTIGINQKVLIIFWNNWVPPTVPEDSRYGDRWTFNVEITKPDGGKDTIGPFTSDPVGGGYAEYIPTQTGTYTIVAKFPDQVLTGLPTESGIPSDNEYVGDTFAASQSAPITLTVQQQQVQGWPETPLPTP